MHRWKVILSFLISSHTNKILPQFFPHIYGELVSNKLLRKTTTWLSTYLHSHLPHTNKYCLPHLDFGERGSKMEHHHSFLHPKFLSLSLLYLISKWKYFLIWMKERSFLHLDASRLRVGPFTGGYPSTSVKKIWVYFQPESVPYLQEYSPLPFESY